MDISIRRIRQGWLMMKTFSNWPQCLWHNYATPPVGDLFEYKIRKGYSFWGRPGTLDRGILMEIWGEQCYAPEGWQLNSTDIIVDIGAHIGVYALYGAAQVSKGCVVAVEPDPENYVLLARNIQHNGISNCHPINLAVASVAGTRDLFLGTPGETGGHSLVIEGGRKSLSVQTITLQDILDKYHLDHIDCLKLDCEGSEYEIMGSLSPELWKKIHRIVMECHDVDQERNLKTLQTLLKDKGYPIIKTQPISPGLSFVYAR